LTAVAVEARGGAGGVRYANDYGGGYGVGYSSGYGPGGIYNTPNYAGNPNRDYAATNQPNYGGYIY
jgi:hypothetical protein